MQKSRKKPPLMRVSELDSATGRTAMKTIRADDGLVHVQWHEALPPKLTRRADALYDRVAKHLGYTPQAWRDGFCMDLHPEREISIWEHIADVVEHLWKSKPAAIKGLKRKLVLEIVVGVSAGWVDIPSQLPGVTDEHVAFIRSVYESD